ncbi:septum site-determining protein Ssd [Nocardioides sp.]|uniref:septum site-determining protein Ssd n=1 Tax=Nocardioides sp. TaxID=35761 RepID=UPI002CBFE62C|nr:septum site-determining protein Ssd [Nocardioides sp.]HXH81129.1 septum site-determining protein Ssd [Nocardioides sp.]
MQPLVLTRDPSLLDDLARLAAGAGVRPEVRSDAVSALASWASAPLVLVGDDLLPDLVAVSPPRRAGVVVVCRDPGSATFRLALDVGASSVAELPSAEAHLAALFADVEEIPTQGLVLGVIGGAGGVGASTLACALGQVAGLTGPSLVLDTDPLGPGLDRVLGLDEVPGVRWDDLAASAGRLGSRSLRDAVPRRDGVGVLTWTSAGTSGSAALPPVSTLRDVLAAGRRGHHLVVLDIARLSGAVSAELMARCDLVLVVTPSSIGGVVSTMRVLASLSDTSHLRLAPRRGPVSASELSATTGVRIGLEVPHQRGVDEAVDLGLGPVRGRRSRLRRAVSEFLAEVA